MQKLIYNVNKEWPWRVSPGSHRVALVVKLLFLSYKAQIVETDKIFELRKVF